MASMDQIQALRGLLRTTRAVCPRRESARFSPGGEAFVATGATAPLDSSSLTRPGSQSLTWPPPTGMQPGALSEWLAAVPGSGAGELAIATLRAVVPPSGRWLVIDPHGELSPAACAQWGVPLEQTVFVSVQTALEAGWVLEQALLSGGVSAVVARVDHLPTVVFRRLQLAAETSGTRGILLRSAAALREPSWADLRVLVTPEPSPRWSCRRLRVSLIKLRHGLPGGELTLELDHEANAVRVVSELADSTRLPRAVRA